MEPRTSVSVPPVHTRRLELVSLSPEFIDSVLGGRRGEAESACGINLPADWPADDERFLRLRLSDMRTNPGIQPWLMRAMVLKDDGRTMAGHIGFHGPPSDSDVAELGYTVFATFRRRGYATEAARALMDWAFREHSVERFRVSISPDNQPSLGMAEKLGFRRIGEQIDEEDGLEIVHELAVG
jgi:ribosomal-protein-alanine N-acetyltransferase